MRTPLLIASSWLLRLSPDPAWALPGQLFEIIVFVWMIAANSFIIKAALEWSAGASVALVILQVILSGEPADAGESAASHALFYPPHG